MRRTCHTVASQEVGVILDVVVNIRPSLPPRLLGSSHASSDPSSPEDRSPRVAGFLRGRSQARPGGRCGSAEPSRVDPTPTRVSPGSVNSRVCLASCASFSIHLRLLITMYPEERSKSPRCRRRRVAGPPCPVVRSVPCTPVCSGLAERVALRADISQSRASNPGRPEAALSTAGRRRRPQPGRGSNPTSAPTPCLFSLFPFEVLQPSGEVGCEASGIQSPSLGTPRGDSPHPSRANGGFSVARSAPRFPRAPCWRRGDVVSSGSWPQLHCSSWACHLNPPPPAPISLRPSVNRG